MASSKEQLNPAALTLEQLVRVLQAAGSKHASQESVDADMAAGAPRNADGTVNLVHYSAWLVKEMGHRGS